MPADLEFLNARLQLQEDGSLSNARAELYVLLRAEEVVSPTAAWAVSGGTKRSPNTQYIRSIHSSPLFKDRLEALMTEKAKLLDEGVRGAIIWQARQIYRRACAKDDVAMMVKATEMLIRMDGRERADDEKDKPKRSVGAPLVEAPQPDDMDDVATRSLLNR
jgi:hypothetical protein